MAATGYTPIQLYYSTTAAAVPTAGNLASGELAINITDGKLYYKSNAGVVTLLAGATAGPAGGSNTQVQFNSSGVLAGSANMTFDGTSMTLGGNPILSAGTANGVTYLNGSKVLTSGSALTFGGANLGVNCTATNFGANYRTFEVAAPQGAYILASDTTNTATCQMAAEASVGYLGMRTNHPLAFIVNNTEGMRLTSTGLVLNDSSRIGGARFSMLLNPSIENAIAFKTSSNANIGVLRGLNSGGNEVAAIDFDTSAGSISFRTVNTLRATLDSAGNLGLGVTPSAWSGFVALQVTSGLALWSSGVANARMNANTYYNGGYKYIGTGTATMYEQDGYHAWYQAASGTAGNAISFTQAMTLAAGGYLGIAQTNPSYKLHIVGGSTVASGSMQLQVGDNVANQISFSNGYGNREGLVFLGDGSSGNFSFGIISTQQALTFQTAAYNIGGASNLSTGWTERARIDSSGNLLVGTTSTYNSDSTVQLSGNPPGNQVLSIRHTGASPNGIYILYSGASPNNTGNYFGLFTDNAGIRFEFRSNGGIANYQANDSNLSDRREKTNFAPAGSYLDKICAIPVQTFNYIDQNLEQDGGLTLGVVAQDVQAVAPELVMESNWAGKGEEPKMRLSIYQTDMQYALMKCIQEQQVIIESLKARLDAANL